LAAAARRRWLCSPWRSLLSRQAAGAANLLMVALVCRSAWAYAGEEMMMILSCDGVMAGVAIVYRRAAAAGET